MLECHFCYDLGRGSHVVSRRTLSRHTQAWLIRHQFRHDRSLPTPGQASISSRLIETMSQSPNSQSLSPNRLKSSAIYHHSKMAKLILVSYIPAYSMSRSNTGNIVDDLNASDGFFFRICEWAGGVVVNLSTKWLVYSL